MVKTLTSREMNVLKLAAAGKHNREIAEILGISVRTVEAHRARGMMKLDLTSSADLVRYALRTNLISATLVMACTASIVAALS
jgi:DNA-binding CsgD family transcriptional regulator